MALAIGTRLGAYEILAVIGAGGRARSIAHAIHGSDATSPFPSDPDVTYWNPVWSPDG